MCRSGVVCNVPHIRSYALAPIATIYIDVLNFSSCWMPLHISDLSSPSVNGRYSMRSDFGAQRIRMEPDIDRTKLLFVKHYLAKRFRYHEGEPKVELNSCALSSACAALSMGAP